MNDNSLEFMWVSTHALSAVVIRRHRQRGKAEGPGELATVSMSLAVRHLARCSPTPRAEWNPLIVCFNLGVNTQNRFWL